MGILKTFIQYCMLNWYGGIVLHKKIVLKQWSDYIHSHEVLTKFFIHCINPLYVLLTSPTFLPTENLYAALKRKEHLV